MLYFSEKMSSNVDGDRDGMQDVSNGALSTSISQEVLDDAGMGDITSPRFYKREVKHRYVLEIV